MLPRGQDTVVWEPVRPEFAVLTMTMGYDENGFLSDVTSEPSVGFDDIFLEHLRARSLWKLMSDLLADPGILSGEFHVVEPMLFRSDPLYFGGQSLQKQTDGFKLYRLSLQPTSGEKEWRICILVKSVVSDSSPAMLLGLVIYYGDTLAFQINVSTPEVVGALFSYPVEKFKQVSGCGDKGSEPEILQGSSPPPPPPPPPPGASETSSSIIELLEGARASLEFSGPSNIYSGLSP